MPFLCPDVGTVTTFKLSNRQRRHRSERRSRVGEKSMAAANASECHAHGHGAALPGSGDMDDETAGLAMIAFSRKHLSELLESNPQTKDWACSQPPCFNLLGRVLELRKTISALLAARSVETPSAVACPDGADTGVRRGPHLAGEHSAFTDDDALHRNRETVTIGGPVAVLFMPLLKVAHRPFQGAQPRPLRYVDGQGHVAFQQFGFDAGTPARSRSPSPKTS